MDDVYIFDFDGTICDLNINWSQWHRGLGQIFSEYVPGFDLHLKGQKVHDYQNIYIRRFGQSLRDQIRTFNAEYENSNLKNFHPHSKVISKIKTLKNPKFLWTANSRSTISNCITKIGLEDAFISWITRDDVDFIKPDPQGFSLIRNSDINLSKYTFVGDTDHDRQAASRAGINFIHINDYEHS